jgi:hypothetical protein
MEVLLQPANQKGEWLKETEYLKGSQSKDKVIKKCYR